VPVTPKRANELRVDKVIKEKRERLLSENVTVRFESGADTPRFPLPAKSGHSITSEIAGKTIY